MLLNRFENNKPRISNSEANNTSVIRDLLKKVGIKVSKLGFVVKWKLVPYLI